jgi:hypothetical protein
LRGQLIGIVGIEALVEVVAVVHFAGQNIETGGRQAIVVLKPALGATAKGLVIAGQAGALVVVVVVPVYKLLDVEVCL